jgi:hypothetical protein
MSRLTTEQQKLFNGISATTIQVWKNAPYIHAWYGGNICEFWQYLLLNAKNTRFMWGEIYIKATTTIH